MPVIAILGASGLIGNAVASTLIQRGFPVVAIARRFTPAQIATFAERYFETPIVELDSAALGQLFETNKIDIIVNCIGVLQDGPRGGTQDVHGGFVGKLLQAIAASKDPMLLMHVSIPGADADDQTSFSRTKRDAEHAIDSSVVAHVILRPGFVIAPTAYGGSAMIRALAALPVTLPADVSQRPFAATRMDDIAKTVDIVARRWRDGERGWRARWDVMERAPTNVGGVIETFRRRFGGPKAWTSMPGWLMGFGARMGDFSALLGWSPPIRTNALLELRRGIAGDPAAWMAATGIKPATLDEALSRLPASVQERWFARLYMLKAVTIVTLAAFWTVSGLIAATVSFAPASAILFKQGFPQGPADAITALTSMADISIGLAIAFRKSCAIGLLCGIATSLCYMAGAALLAPELWIDPLGAMVKTVPAMVLMLMTLAILEDR